jgi:hypothetical protein
MREVTRFLHLVLGQILPELFTPKIHNLIPQLCAKVGQ